MASAVLASRNEPYWGEGKVYMRKYPNNNNNQPFKALNSTPTNESLSTSRKVTIHLDRYSRTELKDLKKRLISELEQVRSLRTRIETREVVADVDPKPKNKTLSPPAKKKILGQKRPCATDHKRSLPDPQIEKLVSNMMKRCGQMLTKLMKHKHGWVFNVPVDAVALGLHDYHQIIRAPMDLGTVKSRLDKKAYKSPLDFASDVRLTFSNAMTYNPKGQDVYVMAETMLSQFDKMFNPAYQKFIKEHGVTLPAEKANHKIFPSPPNVRRPKKSESNRLQSALINPPPVQVQTQAPDPVPENRKLHKPKAKNVNKRQMSFEEKAKLGISLQNMPPEAMDQLVQIIKRNSKLAHDEDEIELDLETIDNETLWELDRFVRHHKKGRREVVISNSISTAPVNKLPANENKKVDVTEEDVDIGEEIPITNFPTVEIEKDAACHSGRSSSSSSSGSSSDSSSSSDSDSGSSSGSESEADSVKSPYVESREPPVT